jgi:hypothetical protein
MTPYSFSLPAGVAPHFVNGEQALAVHGPAGIEGYQTFFLSRLMEFEGGVYVIKLCADDAARFLVGPTRYSTAVFLDVPNFMGPISREVFIPRGLQRLDIQ